MASLSFKYDKWERLINKRLKKEIYRIIFLFFFFELKKIKNRGIKYLYKIKNKNYSIIYLLNPFFWIRNVDFSLTMKKRERIRMKRKKRKKEGRDEEEKDK